MSLNMVNMYLPVILLYYIQRMCTFVIYGYAPAARFKIHSVCAIAHTPHCAHVREHYRTPATIESHHTIISPSVVINEPSIF